MSQGIQRRFLVLHGFQNVRPAGHWHRWLVRQLRDRDELVAYPQLPDPDTPRLETWLATAYAELDLLDDTDRPVEQVVVCHSLGCLLWLHAGRRNQHGPLADRVVLVAPPAPEQFEPEMATFLPDAFDPAAVAASAGSLLMVASDNDPWCPAGADRVYGEPLGIPTVLLPGTGHLDMESGYGPWPGVLDWCLTGRWPDPAAP
jgi:hypothetical protein